MKTINPKVALIYDRVNTPYGGAEIVLKTLHDIYPDAPLYTSISNTTTAPWANKFEIKNSFLQYIPFIKNRHQLLVGLMPLAFESHNLDKYDIIISITSAEAKGVITKANQLHVCYLLTPTRYLYSHKEQYLKSNILLQLPGLKQLSLLFINYLSWWDKQAALRADILVPISKMIADRTKQYYKRDTNKVIYPPVETINIKEVEEIKTKPYLLSLSRLVDYKRVDLSIKACLKLDRKLIVVGSGKSNAKLIRLAGIQGITRLPYEPLYHLLNRADEEEKKIVFTGKITHKNSRSLLKYSTALLMPGEEDFGITGLEASIFGKPVIVFYKSGVAELLKNKVHALHTKTETVEEIIKTIKQLDKIDFNKLAIQKVVKQHTTTVFKKQFENMISKSWIDFRSK